MTREEQEQKILENIPKVYEAGRGSIKNEVANALKGSASGEVVALKDVSPLEHGLGVRVSSKNLLDVSSILGKTVSTNGGTLSCGLDGSITGSGTPTGSTSFHSFTKINIPNGEYILSVTGDFKNLACALYCFSKDGTRIKAISVNNDISNVRFNTYDFPEGFYMSPEIKRKDDNVEMSGTAYFQLEKDTTATAYTPFVPDVGAVKVKAQGANIINITEMLNNQLVDNGDGTYTLTKNGTGGLRFSGECAINIPRGTYIKITNEIIDYNIDSDKTDSFGIQFVGADNTGERTVSFFPEKRGSNQYFAINISKIKIYADSAASNGSYVRFKNFQIEYGKVGSEYEPYIEPVEYAVNADGTVEGVKSIYPATTLTTDTVGALIEVDYNRDINKAFEELRKVILSLGGIL